MSKIIKPVKWSIALLLFWFTYLMLSILTFPSGSLSQNADAAIVLGAAVYGSEASPVFAERLNHAIQLYKAKKVRALVFTGGVGESLDGDKSNEKEKAKAESVVARDYAIKAGVDPQDIFIETKSITTRENLIYAQEILKRENFQTVLLVSDALHLKRAMLMASDLQIKSKASGTPTSRYQSFKTRLPFALREAYFYHHYWVFSE